jgi:hypothetical protein
VEARSSRRTSRSPASRRGLSASIQSTDGILPVYKKGGLLKIQNRSIWRENSLFLEKFSPKIPYATEQGIFRGAGLNTLNEGQHIEYEIEENRGKTSAVNLKIK